MNDDSKGIPSIISGAVALIGLLAGLHPSWSWVVILSQHSGDVTRVLSTVMGFGGVIGTMVTHPPEWLRRPIVGAWQRIRGITPKVSP